ncbi:MAG TPA: hypothetical protein VL099_03235 [Candidatus Binatia bacterium]|nr:hypothetical protein [Candidatus Binatia bacterium]
MDERIRELIRRQTEWQESRKNLTWEEKLHMVAQVREEVARLLPAYRRRAPNPQPAQEHEK